MSNIKTHPDAEVINVRHKATGVILLALNPDEFVCTLHSLEVARGSEDARPKVCLQRLEISPKPHPWMPMPIGATVEWNMKTILPHLRNRERVIVDGLGEFEVGDLSQRILVLFFIGTEST